MAKKPAKRERNAIPEGGGRPITLDLNSFTLICEELARTGSKYKSCEALGFKYDTVSTAIKAMENQGDDTWRDLWNTSYDQYRDSLEVEATRRARDGVVTEWQMSVNPLTGAKERVPKRVEYSDRLMEVLLKGAFPERFREKVLHSGTIGLEPVDAFANLTHKAKRLIRQIIMEDLEEQRQVAVARDAPGAIIDLTAETAGAAIEDMRRAEEEG